MLPLKFFYYRRAKLIFRELATALSFSIGLGVISLSLLGTNFSRAFAQIPTASGQTLQGEKTISQVNILFVNPSVGDDKAGNGGEATPWKTITQALQVAGPNSVIMLSSGTYSAETGEVFPLMLKQGVSIQGDTGNKGRGITIAGGGEYLSRSFGGQNVTIVGANEAGLSGVTVTNTNPRGYGLWIESSNPIIQENTFTENTQDGISVTGNAAPTISKNYFYRNGANGLTVTGRSVPQVRENVFQQTGFGINIAQNANPVVVGNQIQSNRSGVIVQANARPTLRHNLIQDSKEDGLVVIAQAMPDLGSTSEPGGNEFQNNARYDINASAAKQLISAPGNNLANNRIAGKVDIQGLTASIAENSPTELLPNGRLQELPTNGEIVFSAPTIPEIPTQQTAPLPSARITPTKPVARNNSRPLKNQLPQLPADIRVSDTDQQEYNNTVAESPISSNLPTLQSGMPQLNYVQIDTNVIEFNAPLAPQPRVRNQGRSAPAPKSFATGAYGGDSSVNARYRVVVQVTTDKDMALVRSLAPGAFSTVRQGRKVMQAGVFSSQSNARGMLKKFNSKGLRAVVERLN
ncbi:parallel beta-helix repeat (two copies) [Cylindrospermum stagnale PCC 7417]|uniref:Parallel beta-helix repeat (Two copies) n=1 Tax=Cylindrospermum stagnale PCC 7417 TaxID=56107 RepID=K9WVJ1_9NOST|nr:DUF1565 domain-containing protein [Cylindrospermum stagnale]AFZ23834.1 parallel beta-helix repeat (two copies) [Cylindrospermum stagnale PCC 7417]